MILVWMFLAFVVGVILTEGAHAALDTWRWHRDQLRGAFGPRYDIFD